MGLDMYAYAATKSNADYETGQHEIAYWRKHPNLHGWMKNLYHERGGKESFNGTELELTWDDIDRLERTIKSHSLPNTTGFFFGDDADDIYYNDDLKFCVNAKAELFLGLKVFYNSSW
jgi:hypothetical protein